MKKQKPCKCRIIITEYLNLKSIQHLYDFLREKHILNYPIHVILLSDTPRANDCAVFLILTQVGTQTHEKSLVCIFLNYYLFKLVAIHCFQHFNFLTMFYGPFEDSCNFIMTKVNTPFKKTLLPSFN